MAWVDPVHGADTGSPEDQVNDPDQPFKTLNAAILAVQDDMVAAWNNPILLEDRDEMQGTVIALPGIYGPTGGPNGPDASGDDLPIRLLDRVHVQGVGTGRCIIREYRDTASVTNSEYLNVFWPTTGSSCSSIAQPIRPLVEVTTASVAYLDPNSIANTGQGMNPRLPWYDGDVPTAGQDTTEVFDRFTLQGGTVQVYTRTSFIFPLTPRAIISNCVFDMRHGWAPDPAAPSLTIAGPTFGVMMLKVFLGTFATASEGYVDQELLISNNTFVLAQFGQSDWVHSAVDGAVGIIDVSNPNCNGGTCDRDTSQRGLGNAGVINNIFRTLPGSEQRAMMGIDADDTLVVASGPSPANHTNAFALGRLGSSTYFSSAEVDDTGIVPGTSQGEDPIWNCDGITTSSIACPPTSPSSTCSVGTLPYPRVELYDGSVSSTTDRDPGFVGEFLAVQYSADVGEEYPDWRLVPGTAAFLNPMKDKGYAPDPGENTITMANGTVFHLPTHSLAPHPFLWDGEGYGNPRVVDGFPDIGHDEIHLLTMTASYSAYSSSHNEAGCLNSSVPDGQPKRVMILRKESGGVTITDTPAHLVEIHGNHAQPATNCQGLSAWTQPPATLVPSKVKAALPLDYQTKYIRFTDVSLTTLPWGGAVLSSNLDSFLPLGGLVGSGPHIFVTFEVLDDETIAGEHWYFASQAEVFDDTGTDLLRSNLQVEYR